MATTRRRASAKLHLLTARQVQAAAEGDHSDGGGLLLRVRGDSTSWVFRFTAPNGRRREMGLGAVHRGSAAQAGTALTSGRAAAHRAREQLRAGIDPIDDRERQRAADRQVDEAAKAQRARDHWSLARAARDYHARAIETTKTKKHAADWIASLENHVASVVWHKPIADITGPELLEALAGVTANKRARRVEQGARVPETTQRVRQRLEAVFDDAIFLGRCTSNPAAAIRRKMRDELPRKRVGHLAALPYREAPALLARIRAAEGTAARSLEFAVLTAARTNEVLAAEWTEFDLTTGTWVVSAQKMKGGEEHIAYLSPRAVEIVRGQLGQHARWVFPSVVKKDAQQSNMAMLTLLGRLGARDATTVHGLCRATFSTWANETGAARPDVIEACLAHEEGNRVRAAYNRAQFVAERRALLVAWSEYLAKPAGAVLPFRAA